MLAAELGMDSLRSIVSYDSVVWSYPTDLDYVVELQVSDNHHKRSVAAKGASANGEEEPKIVVLIGRVGVEGAGWVDVYIMS